MIPNDSKPDFNGHVDELQDLIGLAPGQDEDEKSYRIARSQPPSAEHDANDANQETAMESRIVDARAAAPARTDQQPMSDALRWALDSLHHPAMASADWLARDIDPTHPTATALLTNPAITLEQVRQAKSVFKTMRIVGEKSADRRIGARMYAAAIAAGIVRFGRKVSTQSDAALRKGFQGLLDDRRMPGPLRDLAGLALCSLKDLNVASPLMSDQNTNGRSHSA